ncbi:MAG: hypothetical protein CVU89_03210 [Firmicutes bacterium HGW-Firmicutes-14]|nr:MAG: hypothetical protein CVU89_03210 [Firmicutes bacterium HGW-Firmicutes-14]
MICPRCGHPNPKSAGECNKCFYKFRFGSGYGDPAKRDPWAFSRRIRNITGGSQDKRIPLPVVFIAVAFILMIVIPLITDLYQIFEQ